ncbi:MAG TPA: zf-TFIIB domain-containing protein [Nocardioides sp.]|uniref:TFIIB-type zinc ribbon-containing protein n=1 Tax=uncultured Nocardioides sp. TaxID=198441 RepID=UPI0026357EEE|nr:zf-TFIIB domain-containing protein [uncultured Nocardioides sp.]HRD62198.1 zf-TFIIB domain-containing protein [Nocardioides sp.]HRI96696.1 zf-TFIIB domain-containing protein [Nocardioides sp.]HRK46727.1 zf-TFIIB domain-containing protein [Nocardioides sp.]
MQCPTDGTTLTMSERSGIEIDYCPNCRGVWLDRGELDKIIERSLTHAGPAAPPAAPAPPQQAAYQSGQQYQQPYQQPYRKKKKESWLSELFD